MSLLHMFALLFAVANPIDDLPFFIDMTRGKRFSNVHLMIIVAVLASFGISVLFMFFGTEILDAFDIGIEAFRIAGGLIIGLLGLKLLIMEDEKKEKEEVRQEEKDVERESLISKAVVPLAIPLLAGPPTISAIVLLTSNPAISDKEIMTVLIILAVVDYLIFLLAGKIAKFLGKIGIMIISKIMGLIMISMGIQYIIFGLTNSFPGWVA